MCFPRENWISALCILVFVFFQLANSVTIKLKDGSNLEGDVLEETDSTIVVKTQILGTLTISRSQLVSTEKNFKEEFNSAEPIANQSIKREYVDPSVHALFFLPTAFTPPKNSFTFRDFELFFLTFGFTPTKTTTLSGGFLFPITTEFQLLTVGFKQNIWHHPGYNSALSLTGNLTKPLAKEKTPLFLNSNLVIGKKIKLESASDIKTLGIHAAMGYFGAFEKGSNPNWINSISYGAGFDIRMSPYLKFMAEYLSATPFGVDTEFTKGIVTFGIRLHGDRLAADIAGIRPLDVDNLDLFLLPLLVVSYKI